MARVTRKDVHHIANSINEMVNKSIIASLALQHEVNFGQVFAARGKNGDAQHIIDQVEVVDYKQEAWNRARLVMVTPKSSIERANCALRKKWNEERREFFEANKKR